MISVYHKYDRKSGVEKDEIISYIRFTYREDPP